jgi:hypothetical protein
MPTATASSIAAKAASSSRPRPMSSVAPPMPPKVPQPRNALGITTPVRPSMFTDMTLPSSHLHSRRSTVRPRHPRTAHGHGLVNGHRRRRSSGSTTIAIASVPAVRDTPRSRRSECSGTAGAPPPSIADRRENVSITDSWLFNTKQDGQSAASSRHTRGEESAQLVGTMP